MSFVHLIVVSHVLGLWQCLSVADRVTAAYNNSCQSVQAFDTVINSAFTAMLVIYGAVAGLGYYYFGDAHPHSSRRIWQPIRPLLGAR